MISRLDTKRVSKHGNREKIEANRLLIGLGVPVSFRQPQ